MGGIDHGADAATGDQLNALADQLGIAVNTVARAYRLLEQDGIVETFGRRGSFIANQGDAIQQQLQSAATQFARRAASLGVSASDAERAVSAAVRAELFYLVRCTAP